MFWNNLKGQKVYSGRYLEQFEVREYLPSFGAEALVFQFAI